MGKYEDYDINIHSILTSNGFLDISIHIRCCGSDFWKYLLLFSPSNSPRLTGLSTFHEFAHNPGIYSTLSKTSDCTRSKTLPKSVKNLKKGRRLCPNFHF